VKVGLARVALEPQPTGFERDEIDKSDCIVARQESGAFARIEDQRIAAQFVAMAMGMSMQQQVDLCRERSRCLIGVVDDQNLATRPTEGARWRSEIHSESVRFPFESDAFCIVVVAKNTKHWNVESRELLEYGRAGDVAGVHDTFDTGLAEESHDSLHVARSIVGVADDADSHLRILSRRSRSSAAGYSVRALTNCDRGSWQGETLMAAASNAKTLKTMLVDKSEGVMTVTLNRPDRLNAFTNQMADDWFTILDDVDADDEVRALIVTGAGRGFCAGADLSGGSGTFDPGNAANDTTDGPAAEHRDEGGLLTLRIFRCRKPIIAAVNGPAVGVGVTSILPMDIRLASTKARFGFVFARRGVVPEACSSWFLPRVVGINRAMEWVATGRVFEAEEALAGGLVSEILEPDALLPRARELALEIAENTSGLSVALARQMMWQMLGASHPIEAHRLDSRAMNYMGAREDSREGVMSFLEKRAPIFPLRVSRDFPDHIGLREEPAFES
jgi:enoyl-CoA hydratase/carnithine racemase